MVHVITCFMMWCFQNVMCFRNGSVFHTFRVSLLSLFCCIVCLRCCPVRERRGCVGGLCFCLLLGSVSVLPGFWLGYHYPRFVELSQMECHTLFVGTLLRCRCLIWSYDMLAEYCSRGDCSLILTRHNWLHGGLFSRCLLVLFVALRSCRH